MVLPLISSSPSSSSRSTRMRNLKNSISTLGVNVNRNNFSSAVSSKAARNGNGAAYHQSNCGYPYFRSYLCGGDCAGFTCDTHLVYTMPNFEFNRSIFRGDEIAARDFTWADIIWYAEYDSSAERGVSAASTRRSIENKKSGTPRSGAFNNGNDHNWSPDDLFFYQQYLESSTRW